jgi:O-antigen ligase
VLAVGVSIEPVLGLYALVAAMFIENLVLVGSLSALRFLVILTYCAWAARSLALKQFEIRVPLQAWQVVAFVIWGGLSVLWSMDVDKSFGALLTMIQSIAIYFLVINLVDSLEKLRVLVAIAVVASVALSLLAIVRALGGEAVAGRVDIVQVFGTGPHALAGYLVPGAAVLMVMYSRQRRAAHRLALLSGLCMVALAILATGTRAAIVALAIVAVLGFVLDRRMWRLAIPALVAGWGAWMYLPSAFLQRLESILTLSDRGAGRLDIWLVALNIIASHPILGVGLDSFGRAFDRYLAKTPGLKIPYAVSGWGSHNVFLNVQAELGLVGLALFLAIVGLAVHQGLGAGLRFKRAGAHKESALALGVWLGLVGMLTVCLFLDWHHAKYLWLLLAIPNVTYLAANRVGDERGCGP